MSTIDIDPEYVAYVSEVAAALKGLHARNVSYWEFYIHGITFGFENEVDNRLAIVQSEHDSLTIKVNT